MTIVSYLPLHSNDTTVSFKHFWQKTKQNKKPVATCYFHG